MEDKKNEENISEEEILNQEEPGTDEKKSEPKTYTEEEVEEMRKKLQSDSDKGVQKVISERKLFEKAYNELPKIAENDARLVDIHEENPELAEKILKDHFNGQSIEEYKESIEYKEDYSDPEKMKAKIEREANKIAKSREVETQKKSFIKKLQMEGEELESFESELTDLLQVKKYQNQDIVKVMETAYKLSANDESIKKLKNKEVIAKSMATTKGDSGNGGKSQPENKNPFDSFFKTHLTRNHK